MDAFPFHLTDKGIFTIGVGLELILAFGVLVAVAFTSGIIRVALIVLAVLLGAFVLWFFIALAVSHPGAAIPA